MKETTMTVLDRIYRQPTRLLAFAAAVLAVLTGVGILDQVGATIALGVVSGAVGMLFYFVTPAAEVVVQETPDGVLRAGPSAVTATGTVLADVALQPLHDRANRQE